MEREMLDNLFRYEDDGLYKKRKNDSQWTRCDELNVGTCGYKRVKVNGKMMSLHRLVYLFHNPDWDILDSSRDNQIDHINGNKLDNKIDNLRVVTNSQNQQNRSHHGGKPIRGICFHKRRSSSWQAQWTKNGKQKNKYFKTESEALEHRTQMVALHYTHDPSKRG